ncbi:hypothetical protein AJ79_04528 [Helicocarpus griseus UAMH5409]|uniref:Uncharacterized protein n=1 Tax=Helicocarpus griseus UAMH5409 TaxID=1447875 RepID=A0A2B7XST6_9EURO|nr:hypothetical protein AJ79_04528 [Helicocarpus griseus UAMH5409]
MKFTLSLLLLAATAVFALPVPDAESDALAPRTAEPEEPKKKCPDFTGVDKVSPHRAQQGGPNVASHVTDVDSSAYGSPRK